MPDLRSKLQDLLALCERMTPGDWRITHRQGVSYVFQKTKLADVYSEAFRDTQGQEANASGIVALRNDFPDLAREMLAQTDLVEALLVERTAWQAYHLQHTLGHMNVLQAATERVDRLLRGDK